jgi:hypothetical protein
MAAVAHWIEAQPEQPKSWPLASPCRQVRAQRTADVWSPRGA